MNIDSLQSAASVWWALADPSKTVRMVMDGWLASVLAALALVWALARWRRTWLVVRTSQWLLAGYLLVAVVHHVQDSVDRSAAAYEAANRANAKTVQNEFGLTIEPSGLGCLQGLGDGADQECRVTAYKRGRSAEYVFAVDGDMVIVSRGGPAERPLRAHHCP